jgi:hypothetical protein
MQTRQQATYTITHTTHENSQTVADVTVKHKKHLQSVNKSLTLTARAIAG